MTLNAVLLAHEADYHRVVPFDPSKDRLYFFDFTENNKDLTPEAIADTEAFANYINRAIKEGQARYGFGGYGEHRTLYARSKHFDTAQGALSPAVEPERPSSPTSLSPASAPGPSSAEGAEPRRLHLGIDIWGQVGTKVMAPLDGVVHSFAFNNNDSDYGATIILTHQLDGVGFHTLYGHLSLNSLKNLHEGKTIRKGDVIAEFGMRFENGNWPPHLHFQIIDDIGDWKGDYPGVCKYSERQKWLDNCPDANLILQMR